MLPLQGNTQGTAAGWLTRENLIGLQELFNEKFLSQYPLLSLFETATHDSKKMVIETMIHLLQTGVLTARPEAGRRLDPTMLSKRLIQPFFDQYILDLEDDQAVSLMLPGSGGVTPSALEQAVRKLTSGVGTHIETYWRTLHKIIAGIMSTPGGYTLTTADGVEHSIDWGFPTSIYSADWATTSTDVLTDFGRMKRKFKRLNQGRDANFYVFPGNFHNQYLLANTELREAFIVRHPEIMRAVIPTLELPQGDGDRSAKPPRIIIVDDAVIDESSSAATGTDDDLVDVWPRNIFGIGYSDSIDDNFKLNTVRTIDNEFKGGLSTTLFREENPPSYHIRVSGNHVPSWANPNRYMICKVSASATEVTIADI